MKLEDFKEFELQKINRVVGGKDIVTASCSDSNGFTTLDTIGEDDELLGTYFEEYDTYDSSKGDPYLGKEY